LHQNFGGIRSNPVSAGKFDVLKNFRFLMKTFLFHVSAFPGAGFANASGNGHRFSERMILSTPFSPVTESKIPDQKIKR